MSAARPRVVITGIGVVSPFGVGRELFWDRVSHGNSGIRAITEFDASRLANRVSASVPAEALRAAGVETDEPHDDPSRNGNGRGDGNGRGNGNGRADPRRYAKVSRIAVLAAREAPNSSRTMTASAPAPSPARPLPPSSPYDVYRGMVTQTGAAATGPVDPTSQGDEGDDDDEVEIPTDPDMSTEEPE